MCTLYTSHIIHKYIFSPFYLLGIAKMPEEHMVAAGVYRLNKQFRNETYRRRQKDMPWTKKILDLDHKKLFGRTAWAWFRIIGYYTVLYMFIVTILIFWFTLFELVIIEKDRPHWLKDAPGLSVFPTNETTIIYFRNLMSDIVPLANKIDEVLYKLNDGALEYFHDCNDDDAWGFAMGRPCFFIKLNYVYGFKAHTYDSVSDLPKNAPPELEEHVQKFPGVNRIWLTCKVNQGPTPKIEYVPGPYFTVSHTMRSSQRVVAVQLNDLEPNSNVFITCTSWARNLPIDLKHNGRGHVKFSINMREGSKPQGSVELPVTHHDEPMTTAVPKTWKNNRPNADLLNAPSALDVEPPEEVVDGRGLEPTQSGPGNDYEESMTPSGPVTLKDKRPNADLLDMPSRPNVEPTEEVEPPIEPPQNGPEYSPLTEPPS